MINGRVEIEPGHAEILIVIVIERRSNWIHVETPSNVHHYTYNYKSIGDLFGSTLILSYYSI